MDPTLRSVACFVLAASALGGCTPFAQSYRGMDLTERYNRVVARKDATDPTVVGPAAADAERCANDPDGKENLDASLPTATGTMTTREVLARCTQIKADFEKRTDAAAKCEARSFIVFTDAMAGGRWTDPDFVPDHHDSRFERAICPDPATVPARAPSGLTKVHAGLLEECGREAQITFDGDWESRKNQLGIVVRRERFAACYVARKR